MNRAETVAMRTRLIRQIVPWFLLSLVAILFPATASASTSLDRHSPDFQVRLSGYGDVWTQQEVSVFEGVLINLKQHGLVHTLKTLSGQLSALSKLINKLRLIDDRLSLMMEGILGLSKDIPEDLLSRVTGLVSGDRNVSKLIKTINDLYTSGELSSVDYLMLLGYVANEFKAEYVEDDVTLANIGRAVDEVSLAFTKSVVSPLPEPNRPSSLIGRMLLVKAPEISGLALVVVLSTVLAPLVAQILYILATRPQYPKFVRKVLRTSDTVVSSLAFPEDTISAYWAAVNIISRVVPVFSWETHREYIARLSKELENQHILSAFRTLTDEYERVRFAGEKGELSRKQLADLVSRIEKLIRS